MESVTTRPTSTQKSPANAQKSNQRPKRLSTSQPTPKSPTRPQTLLNQIQSNPSSPDAHNQTTGHKANKTREQLHIYPIKLPLKITFPACSSAEYKFPTEVLNTYETLVFAPDPSGKSSPDGVPAVTSSRSSTSVSFPE